MFTIQIPICIFLEFISRQHRARLISHLRFREGSNYPTVMIFSSKGKTLFFRSLLRIRRGQFRKFGLRQVLSRQGVSAEMAPDLSRSFSRRRRSEPRRNRIIVQSGEQVCALCQIVLGNLGLGSSSGLTNKHMLSL